ncbi:GlyGly-CTERM sorting domain-containing protein, partial [Vibrio parahaemolyticus]
GKECHDGIATNNCDFKGSDDDGGSLNLWLLALFAPLAWWRRREA